jgi:histidine triad (HIT) family protein
VREVAVFNHEPEGYHCRFCGVLAGVDNPRNTQQDIVCRTDKAAALISPGWWPNNHGHVLVISTAHHENLYDLPDDDGHAIYDLVRRIAIAMRHTYGCDGVSTRQHNEPAGYQDVWHFHMHVFPRYHGDELYRSATKPTFFPAEERRPYADRLRDYLDQTA